MYTPDLVKSAASCTSRPLSGVTLSPYSISILINSRQCSFSHLLTLPHPCLTVDSFSLPMVKFQEIIRKEQSTIVRPLPSCLQTDSFTTHVGHTDEGSDCMSNQHSLFFLICFTDPHSLQVTCSSFNALIPVQSVPPASALYPGSPSPNLPSQSS
jgi:hypothetical protein